MLWNSTLWKLRKSLPIDVVAAMTAVDIKLNMNVLGGGMYIVLWPFSHGRAARGLEMASKGLAEGTEYVSSRAEEDDIRLANQLILDMIYAI
jgi:hypothetical protein